MKKSKKIIASTVIAGALMLQGTLSNAQPGLSIEPVSTETIRPFKVHFPKKALNDLKQRIKATRWPDKETVADQSQGAQLAELQKLMNYWATDYDWRKAEAKLNALPQFMTTIDSVDIYFIHVRSEEPKAMPLIITHGWPGSIFEFLKTIDPLTNPTAYGGKAEDAFDVVIPAIPGYGFSGKPTGAGWDHEHIAKAWAELMSRLGYTRYVAQGGDRGAPIASEMARQSASGLLGIHLNLPATVPPEVAAVLNSPVPAPATLSDEEHDVFNALRLYARKGNSGYFITMTARPQAIGYGLNDSPTGLAAWMLVHPGFAEWNYGNEPEKSPTKDEVLDNITLYWLTNSAASSARLYWETAGRNPTSSVDWRTTEIQLPVAITVFPDEVYRPPLTWAKRAYKNLIYFHQVDKGGHFAAWEQPQIFAEEMRVAFKSLR